VEGLTGANGAFRDVSFSVRAGEIFGIAGIVGAGRTALVRAIAGADRLAAGSVFIEGQPVQFRSPEDAINAGVVLVPEDRKAVMLARKRGSVVNIASMSGIIVNRGLMQAHYNASKAAVIHLSKSLAMEWCDRGVRVNSISPGYTATPMNLRPEMAGQTKQFEAETPLGRMATVYELVGPAIFLSSKAASFCTGVDLIVDGGFVCW
jgi:NAD(P)-dependent dehydrogenase (short-subunit alcohol dehydrogenase family)